MKDEIKKLDDMILFLKSFMDSIYKSYGTLSREVVFSAMVIKKTIDILETAKFTLKNYIISVQISLMRLLCDNAIAIESVNELGLEKVMDMINNNIQVNTVMVDEEQNMSDGYLKRKVSERYRGFDRLYRFASSGVHFSKTAIGGAFYEDKDGKIVMNVDCGNKELKKEIIENNGRLITLSKVIVDMLKNIVTTKKKKK